MPRITWLSTTQQDLRSRNLTLPEAMDMAQNRSLWRMWSTSGTVALHNRELHARNDDDDSGSTQSHSYITEART